MKATGSSSWTSVEVISTESTGPSYYPDVSCDRDGNLHVVYYDSTDYLSSGVDSDIFYKKRSASTSNWGIAEVISTESDADSSTPKICVTEDEHLYVIWADDADYDLSGADSDIFFKQKKPSDDWETATVLSWFSDDHCFEPEIACEENGRIHVVWKDYSNILNSGLDKDIIYTMYAPNLDSWTTPYLVSSMCNLDSSYPYIAVDKFGDIHIVWRDLTPIGASGSDTDILYRIFDSSSLTWSQALVVSTDSTTTVYDETASGYYGMAVGTQESFSPAEIITVSLYSLRFELVIFTI